MDVELMEQMISKITDFGTWLRESGLTAPTLLLAGTLFLITFVLSLREILAWYLKITKLQSTIIDLRQAIERLERRLDQQQSLPTPDEAKSTFGPSILTPKSSEPESKAFPLSH